MFGGQKELMGNQGTEKVEQNKKNRAKTRRGICQREEGEVKAEGQLDFIVSRGVEQNSGLAGKTALGMSRKLSRIVEFGGEKNVALK